MDSGLHWEGIWSSREEDALSWFEPYPSLSLELVDEALSGDPDACVLDVGGGQSRLAEVLFRERGLDCLAVLDVSGSALEHAAARLGKDASHVQWIRADVTRVTDLVPFDIWHDRAVFHFLTDPADRAGYVELVERTIPPGGHVVMATFGPKGPARCSGLPVERFGPKRLSAELGACFSLVRSFETEHRTPSGKTQSFLYALFRRA